MKYNIDKTVLLNYHVLSQCYIQYLYRERKESSRIYNCQNIRTVILPSRNTIVFLDDDGDMIAFSSDDELLMGLALVKDDTCRVYIKRE